MMLTQEQIGKMSIQECMDRIQYNLDEMKKLQIEMNKNLKLMGL